MSDHNLRLEAALDIAHAAQFKTTLDTALSGEKSLSLDGGEVSRVDAAGLQLLLAFVRQCKALEIELSWDSASETLRDAAAGLGLAQALQLQLPNQEA